MAILNVDAGVTRVVQSPRCTSNRPVAASAIAVQTSAAVVAAGHAQAQESSKAALHDVIVIPSVGARLSAQAAAALM
jgi:hypothetical protein